MFKQKLCYVKSLSYFVKLVSSTLNIADVKTVKLSLLSRIVGFRYKVFG